MDECLREWGDLTKAKAELENGADYVQEDDFSDGEEEFAKG